MSDDATLQSIVKIFVRNTAGKWEHGDFIAMYEAVRRLFPTLGHAEFGKLLEEEKAVLLATVSVVPELSTTEQAVPSKESFSVPQVPVYNASSIGSWSILLTPVWGSIMAVGMLNDLGNKRRSELAELWVGISAVVVITLIVLGSFGDGEINFSNLFLHRCLPIFGYIALLFIWQRFVLQGAIKFTEKEQFEIKPVWWIALLSWPVVILIKVMISGLIIAASHAK